MRLMHPVRKTSLSKGVNHSKYKNQPDVIDRNSEYFNNTSLIAGAVTGLLFGLHPLHVESVAWVSERKDVLYSFFFLLSILSYLKYTSSFMQNPLHSSEKGKSGRIHYGLCLLFFTLSLLSKPMAVTLPVVLILLDFYPLERLDFRSVFRSRYKVLIEKVPFLGLSLVSVIITVMANQVGGAIQSLVHYHLIERIFVIFKSLCFYLFKMIWPADLAPFYPYPNEISVFTLEYAGAFILVLGITAFCIYSWRKQKIWLAVWSYYFITLLPVLGIIQTGAQAAADRYTYLSSLGPFLLLGLAARRLMEKFFKKEQASIFIKQSSAIALMTIMLITFSYLTIKQIAIWKNSITLWNHELKIFPNKAYVAYLNRGKAFADLDNYSKAIEDYNKAIEINPDIAATFNNRGTVYTKLGDYLKALSDYYRAIEINPKYYKAYYNRGKSYENLGDYPKAVEDYNKTIELNPGFEEAYYNLGVIYDIQFHNYVEAVKYYSKSIELNPQYTKAYNNRGAVYATIGNFHKSIKDFDIAIAMNNNDSAAYYNRGMAYKMLGNRLQAGKDFRSAARLGDKKAQNYLMSKEKNSNVMNK
jgi:tetratricopeptide (TPR) repeat protein